MVRPGAVRPSSVAAALGFTGRRLVGRRYGCSRRRKAVKRAEYSDVNGDVLVSGILRRWLLASSSMGASSTVTARYAERSGSATAPSKAPACEALFLERRRWGWHGGSWSRSTSSLQAGVVLRIISKEARSLSIRDAFLLTCATMIADLVSHRKMPNSHSWSGTVSSAGLVYRAGIVAWMRNSWVTVIKRSCARARACSGRAREDMASARSRM